MSEDEGTQRFGNVIILYTLSKSGFNSCNSMFDAGLNKQASRFPTALPVRNVAFHYCYHDALLVPALSAVQLAVGASGRVRFRAHYGEILTF
jgi:hypothetical protein